MERLNVQIKDRIDQFLTAGPPFCVIGASKDREKYGNKVLRCYQQHKLEVHVIHPTQKEIEGISCVKEFSLLPKGIQSISIITPPKVTDTIIPKIIDCGAKNIWLQPGAESEESITAAESAGINVIAGGPCLLVVLGYTEAVDQTESS